MLVQLVPNSSPWTVHGPSIHDIATFNTHQYGMDYVVACSEQSEKKMTIYWPNVFVFS